VTRRSAIVLGAVAVLVVWLAASAYLFVWPPDDRVRRADALVVLGEGQHGQRLRKGEELLRHHVAREFVVSVPEAKKGWVRLRSLCSQGRAMCFRARPFTTRGEAEQVARLARRHTWRSLIVVTSRYHVVRARLLYGRCFDGALMVVGAKPSHRPIEVVKRTMHEWGGLINALTMERGC
jgi:uncharacterized SAM-binding protein YcdF (DUF218 family)